MRKEIYTEYHFRINGEKTRRVWFTAPVLVDLRGIMYADGIFERYHNADGKRDEITSCSVGIDNGVRVDFNYCL